MRRPKYTAAEIPCEVFSYSDKGLQTDHHSLSKKPDDRRALNMENIKQYFVPSKLGERALVLTQFSDKEPSRIIVYGAGWANNPTSTAGQLEAAEMAQAWNDNGVPAAILSLPTGSTKRNVAREMAKTDSFQPLAEEIAPQLDTILYRYFNGSGIVGHSFGARLAVNLPGVLSSPEKVEFLTVDDPPSWRKPLGVTGIATAQLAESIHLAKYVEHASDIKALNAWQNTDDGEHIADQPLAVQLNDIIAMSKEGFMEDIKSSLKRLKPGTPVTLFAPELSHMNANNRQHVQNFVIQLHKEFPDLDFRGISVDDSSHNVSVANPAYFRQMVEISRHK